MFKPGQFNVKLTLFAMLGLLKQHLYGKQWSSFNLCVIKINLFTMIIVYVFTIRHMYIHCIAYVVK